MQKEDFLEAARSMSGSRDVGAHLFCSMLRAAGIEARLVCSLQPLQFRAAEKAPTPQRQYTMVIPDIEMRDSTPESDHEQREGTATRSGTLNERSARTNGARLPNRTKSKALILSHCPG